MKFFVLGISDYMLSGFIQTQVAAWYANATNVSIQVEIYAMYTITILK